MYKMGEESMEYTYKIVPYMYWQTTEFEKWLSDLALEGLEVVKLGETWIKLKRIQPKRLIYKIMLDEESIEKEYKETDGWNKVHTSNKFCLYVSEEEQAKVWLEYDHKKEIQKVEGLLNACKIDGIMTLLLLVVWAVMFSFSIGQGLVYKLLTGSLTAYIILFISYIILLPQKIKEFRGLKALKLRVEGKFKQINNQGYEKIHKDNLIRVVTSWITIIIFILTFISILSEDDGYMKHSIESIDIPIVSLASLETDSTFSRMHQENKEDIDWKNSYEKKSNLFLSTQYEMRETGKVENSKLKVDEPFINQTIYEINFKSMIKPFTNSLLKGRITRGYREMEAMEEECLDSLYIHEIWNGIEIIAVKGKVVMELYYRGNGNKEEVIEQVIQTLDCYQ